MNAEVEDDTFGSEKLLNVHSQACENEGKKCDRKTKKKTQKANTCLNLHNISSFRIEKI